jgi:hypothetical protein
MSNRIRVPDNMCPECGAEKEVNEICAKCWERSEKSIKAMNKRFFGVEDLDDLTK